MLLSLKKGGIAVFSTREEYLTKYGYGPYIDGLENDKKWEKLHDDKVTKYANIGEGNFVGRYTPKVTSIFAYRKLWIILSKTPQDTYSYKFNQYPLYKFEDKII